jgi:nitrate/TMAO reductase-like tetraheme cytochrome c subunit
VTAVVAVASLTGLTVYSGSPSFCKSCHIMEPYYEAWQTSAHKDVPCIDCHYPPGAAVTHVWHKFQALSQVAKYVTRTYSSKPYAEIPDESCLRSGCHSTRLMEGRLTTASGIHFDHRPHLQGVRYGRKLRCVSCHSQVVVGKHVEVTWDTCFLCHRDNAVAGREIEPMAGCLACHELPDKEFQSGNITYNHKSFMSRSQVACVACHQDVFQGEGNVPPERCFSCHNQEEKLAKYSQTAFLHDTHVTKHNTACFHCHTEIRHRATPAGTKKLEYECSACHVDTHDLQRDLYRGVGAKEVPPMPSPMYLANVDCVGCHLQETLPQGGISHERTFVGSEQGCIACHGERYAGVLEETHAVVNEATTRLSGLLTQVQAGMAKAALSEADTTAVRDDIAQAAYNLDFLVKGHAVHNVYYAGQVAAQIIRKLTAAGEKVGVDMAEIAELPLATGSYCATLCHAKVGVDVPAKEVQYDGRKMPHKTHVELDLACTACHALGQHKEVKLKDDAMETVCKDCHKKGFK